MPPVSQILTEPFQRVFLEEGEFVLETTSHRRLGSQDDYLESLFAGRYSAIPGAFQVASTPAHLLVNTNEVMAFMRLENLPFRTAFIFHPFHHNYHTPVDKLYAAFLSFQLLH